MSAREIYENGIRQLPAMDRLRLASIILDDLAKTNGGDLDISDEWSDEEDGDEPDRLAHGPGKFDTPRARLLESFFLR